ncbi:MAG: hypothetical protein P8X57_03510 [Cyclobacteriaceae bacterium]
MRFDAERLYELLPAVYRLRDARLAKEGEMPPLKAFISILADELDNLEENLDQLYDDQFIETCSEWVVPYIGELVGNRPLIQIPDAKFSMRAEVANTIAYRRRKGTASIIEQLARDITGWDSNVVEYFELLITTQYLNHLRPHNIASVDLKNWEQLEEVNSPFNKLTRTADIRSISKRRGKHNIPNIGVFLWRVSAFFMDEVNARQIGNTSKYTFHPLGVDMPLYRQPVAEDEITHLASPENVSQPVTRRQLLEDHKAWTEQETDDNYVPLYFNAADEASEKMQIRVGDDVLTPDQWHVCNLGGDLSGDWLNLPNNTDKVFIDPELGRISFPTGFTPAPAADNVRVSFNYGFGIYTGGGPYDRKTASTHNSSLTILKVPLEHGTIQAAIDAAGTDGGIIEIGDNATYEEDIMLEPAAGAEIIIRAMDGERPALIGDIIISDGNSAKVELNGILIDGSVEVEAASQLRELRLVHVTIKPGIATNQLIIASFTPQLFINHSIVSGIRIVEGADARIENSIIDVIDQEHDAYAGLAAGPGGKLYIENSTVVGQLTAKQIEYASNCIFTSVVRATQTQKGCMRFSWFPRDSVTPKAYKCQPAFSGKYDSVKPVFSSGEYGQPDYLQLDNSTPPEILYGADNGSEMGVYFQQYTAQKITNLRIRLDEYLRFGLEAGIFLAS